ncbi:hypothetical protein LTS16_023108 [Friedmanniomyces endolithicus]|uniref:THUMP domain-containing protein n=1 Tax=Friedmanniomyces endolithicus TaxID=329885 RepID=A0AAN6J739_9PEZI|nr:hypothetical protein LTR35_002133 [Friedmanniomyces endolithicus]KAK0299823.1 hypothetical protein LTS00_001593 [Friedmanniomyces endolithicus]KAK0319302.1 hypothetical protein LTR82_009719 [Friedmanniomyces endolithicus]KAK0826237.1 hypothetical protein LTR73_006571 [Friedmanniomyces endolithicus]KAK0909862.1 hypothetical protein LTR57_016124 [Friedmanniomyces endolithicus]
MEAGKRKLDDSIGRDEKRPKFKKQWQVPRRNDHGGVQAKAIQPGDSGIWATCNKGREGKCVGELQNLFTEYAELLYGSTLDASATRGDGTEMSDAADIESEIQAEVAGIRKPSAVQLFTSIRLHVQCVVFFKTVSPIEPVSFVKRICEDAANNSALKRTRFTKRLSPMTLMGRPSADDLGKIAAEVLAPHFHQEPVRSRKFAIRPSIRNHNILNRESVIKQIASIVGPDHTVDLKSYELLIIVEIYQNICGISVVDDSFERLKRYNLAEIFDPTPKEALNKVEATPEDPEGAIDDSADAADLEARPMGIS